LKYPICGFEADRDVIGKLNTRRRALEILGIKADFGEFRTLQMTDVNPNR
jgi:transposase